MSPIHEKLNDTHQFKIYGYKTYRNSIEDFVKIKKSFSNYLKEKLESFSGKSCDNFSLENYHKHTDELSWTITNLLKRPVEKFRTKNLT